MSININLSEISRLVKKARENNVDIILTISADNEDELEIEERPHTEKLSKYFERKEQEYNYEHTD